jgi:hypothetical protein
MPSRASKTAKSGKFGTMDTDMTHRKDYKGIPFKTFVDRYGKREDGGFGIKGYKTPNTSYPQQSLSAKHVLHYHQVDAKKDPSYMNAIIKHAKEIPDPRKYQDTLLVNWCKPQMECKFKIPVSNSHETFKGKFGQAEKVTLFAALGKQSKRPGPTTYNDDKSKDARVLKRTDLGIFKR